MPKSIRFTLVLLPIILGFLVIHGATYAAEGGASARQKGGESVTGVQDGFRLVAYSGAVSGLAKEVCAKTSQMKDSGAKGTVYTCYAYEWQDWVKQAFAKRTNRFKKAIEGDYGVMVPATSVLEYPDGSKRLVFGGCRQHACPEAQVLMLVDPKGKDMDIIWQTGGKTDYIGPNSEILRQNRIYDLLWKNWSDL